MAQADYLIQNGPGALVRADINDQLAAIVTSNSGSTPPNPTYPYMRWFDEANGQLKIRNSANTAWVIVASLVGNTWVPYRSGSAVGSAATRDVGTSSSSNLLDRSQLDARYAQRGNNLSDVNAAAARTNLGVMSTVEVTQALSGLSFDLSNSTNQKLSQLLEASVGNSTLAAHLPATAYEGFGRWRRLHAMRMIFGGAIRVTFDTNRSGGNTSGTLVRVVRGTEVVQEWTTPGSWTSRSVDVPFAAGQVVAIEGNSMVPIQLRNVRFRASRAFPILGVENLSLFDI